MTAEFQFAGHTYVPERDYARLKNNLQRVFSCLLDGHWHTLSALRSIGGTGADTRLRDLRKDWCGSMVVEQRATEKPGVHEYRLDLASVSPEYARKILCNEVRAPVAELPLEVESAKSEMHAMIELLTLPKDIGDVYRLLHRRVGTPKASANTVDEDLLGELDSLWCE